MKKRFEQLGGSFLGGAEFAHMFESVKPEEAKPSEPEVKPEIKEEITEQNFFESVKGNETLLTEALAKSSETALRAQAMSAAIEFANEGFSTADELDLFAVGIADVDEDGDVSEAEQEEYELALNTLAEALVSLGVNAKTVESALGGDDDAAEQLSVKLQDVLDDADDTDALIAHFSVREQLMMEASRRKVVRDGKIQWIKKPLKKRRMSAAQKQALKKARRKANTGAAKRARAKSMRLRKKSGL